MSNVGKWDNWYANLDTAQPYGDTETYQLGYEFLKDCSLIEDWGCGKGWFKQFCKEGQYRGIDGSWSKFADEVVDLETYQSTVPAIYMRHVLEHNYNWNIILDNASQSFQERMVLVLFTPLAIQTKEIAFAPNPGVPDISFNLDDILNILFLHKVTAHTMATATQYGTETIFYIEKVGR